MSVGDNLPLALMYHDDGVKPQIYVHAPETILIVGFNLVVIAIDYTTGKEYFRKERLTPIYEYMVFDDLGVILVVCQMNIYALNRAGKQIWTIGFRDDIVDYKVDGHYLFVEDESGLAGRFTIKEGKWSISDNE
jgi:outer membrane protein assembly factor BamB